MLINPLIPGHKVLLGLWPQESPVWPQIKLLFGRRLPGHGVDDQEPVLIRPQHRAVLLTAPVHVGAVHEGRELVELLPGVTLAHGGRADKVEAGHGDVNPGVERVPRGNRDVETSRIVRSGIFTAI